MTKLKFVFDYIKTKRNKAKGTILIIPAFAANFGPYHKVLDKFSDYDIYMLFVPGGLEINCRPIYKEMNKMLRLNYIANYVIDFIKTKKLKDVILMGHCTATSIIGLVGSKCNSLISKVILIVPYCKAFELSKDLVKKSMPAYDAKTLIESGKVIFKKQTKFTDSAYLARCNEIVKKFRKYKTQLEFYLDKEIYANKTFTKVTKAYTQIKKSILICMSEEDPVLKYKEAYKELKKLLPNAKFAIFNNSKHMLFEEEPTKFGKVVKEFLN